MRVDKIPCTKCAQGIVFGRTEALSLALKRLEESQEGRI